MILALNSRLSVSVTMTSSAPSTTCALVITKPSALRMKPEPTPRCCGSSSPPRGPRARVGAAGQRDAEAAEELLDVRIDLAAARGTAALVVRMLTTAGPDPLDQFGEVGQPPVRAPARRQAPSAEHGSQRGGGSAAAQIEKRRNPGVQCMRDLMSDHGSR